MIATDTVEGYHNTKTLQVATTTPMHVSVIPTTRNWSKRKSMSAFSIDRKLGHKRHYIRAFASRDTTDEHEP